MANAYSDLDHQTFDVVIIGGGINGASAAQALAAAGYSCLVVDSNDFGSGATGRSSRVLHNGLRYFDAPNPVLHYGLRPDRLLNAARMARNSMKGIAELKSLYRRRIWPFQMCFPIYSDDTVKPWHVEAGLRLLNGLGRGHHHLTIEKAMQAFETTFPFAGDLRDTDRLQAIFSYTEYKLDWPERLCMDALLDAEQNGAVLRNYCVAKIRGRDSRDLWDIALTPANDADATPAVVGAKRVLNMAGPWVDTVFDGGTAPRRLIQGAKGTNFMVRLPDRYRGYGITSRDKNGHHILVLPVYENLYSIGVTETEFTGDARDVRPGEEEIGHLLSEVNQLLPGLGLQRGDVLKAWSGVRPHQYDGKAPLGVRAKTLHDLSEQNLPGIFALTAGPIMTYRDTGRMTLDAIAKTLRPSKSAKKALFMPNEASIDRQSAAFCEDVPEVLLRDIEVAARSEYGETLSDILLRRTGLAWYTNLSEAQIRDAADIVGTCKNWSPARKDDEVSQFKRFLKEEMLQTINEA